MTNIPNKNYSLGMAEKGLSLIELMIAMVLGLLVVGAAIGIFLSNKQAYRATQGLGRIQEGSQVAFELMSRDIREAGANPCDVNLAPGNIAVGGTSASPTSSNWYLALTQPLHGFEGGGPAHDAGTDVLQLIRTADDMRTVTVDTAVGATSVTFSPGVPAFNSGDPVMICDMKVLGIFLANGASGGNAASGTLSYGASSGTNACGYFPQPNAGICAGAATAYQFPKFTTVSALQGVRWYVNDPDGNAANGSSLLRQVNGGAAEEILQDVSNLQFQYLTAAGYVDADAVGGSANWNAVRAVRISLTLQEPEPSGTNGSSQQRITRTFENVVTLRNRVL